MDILTGIYDKTLGRGGLLRARKNLKLVIKSYDNMIEQDKGVKDVIYLRELAYERLLEVNRRLGIKEYNKWNWWLIHKIKKV